MLLKWDLRDRVDLTCLLVRLKKHLTLIKEGDYKRSGTRLQSFLVKISKTFWFLWLYLNSISCKYKGNFRIETP